MRANIFGVRLMGENADSEGGVKVPFDLIIYSGAISRRGYEHVSRLIAENKKHDTAVIALATPGGDPHAGFRIARALGCTYERFYALVPRYCKSAGTLILLGASALYLDDMSELGPLDIQVKKGDEIIGQNSGLEFINAVNYLQNQSMTAFRDCLMELTSMGLSTRIASDIAAKLTTGLFEPISAQVDPLKLAEMQRATEIAYEYGLRLAEKSGNIRPEGLPKLVTGYPSHGFVIDRKEAKSIFWKVMKPTGLLGELSTALSVEMSQFIDRAQPDIKILSIPEALHPAESTYEERAPSGVDPARGAAGGEHALDGDLQGTPQGQHLGEPADPVPLEQHPSDAANDAAGGATGEAAGGVS